MMSDESDQATTILRCLKNTRRRERFHLVVSSPGNSILLIPLRV